RIRTCNLWLRRPALYPIELRDQDVRPHASAGSGRESTIAPAGWQRVPSGRSRPPGAGTEQGWLSMSVGFEETVGNGRETGSAGERPAPLGLVLLLTFLGSMGTGAVTNGIYFITNSALHYGRRENLWLGVALGVTYLGGAAFAGSMLRLVRRSPKVSTRAVMAGILALMGVACLVPLAAQYLAPTLLGPAVWARVLVYAPATGGLWAGLGPYISGGRGGQGP